MFGLVSKRKVMNILNDHLEMYESYEKMAKSMNLEDCVERSKIQSGAVRSIIEDIKRALN